MEHDGLTDPGLGSLEPAGQDLFVHLRCTLFVELKGALGATGLDHHDGDLGIGAVIQRPAGDDQLEGRLIALFEGGVRDPLPVGRVGDPHGADRPLERDARQHQGGGCRIDGEDVVGVDLVCTEDGADDVDLVAEALGEGRTQRPVDQAAGEDGLVRGLALSTEERAGDLARRIGPLLDVDGQRKEVRSLAHRAGCGGGSQQDGVADASDDGAVGQLGQLPGLEGECSVGAADGRRNNDGV